MGAYKTVTVRILLFMLGMVSMSTQVIMIREALAIFHGNELIIGLFLGMWMLLTATGSNVAVQSSKFKVQSFLLLLFFLLPLVTLFLFIILRYAIVPYGVMPGPGQTALVFFLALAPFCLVSGMLFPIQVQSLSDLSGKNRLHEGYALDSAGSILGGILFSLVFIFTLPPYESLILLSTFCLIILFILFIIFKKIILAISAMVIGLLIFIMPTKPEIVRYLDQKQFNKQDVIEIKLSPYGMLAVSKMGEELMIYENGVPLNLGDDPFNREEAVHYAMLLHPSPKKILMISGGTSGIIDEILKYPIDKVDYVESDPWLLRLLDKYQPLPTDGRINYIFKDPRIFLSRSTEKYDVILINTPEPNSAELNRFYTVEFYNLLKGKLNPGGILSLSFPSAGNYMSETSRQVHSVTFNSLKSEFDNIRIIPGWRDYFLASDSTLDRSIFKNYPGIGFTNLYVDPSYVTENLLKMRSELIMRDILPDAPVNSDLKPLVFSLFLKQWLEHFKIREWVLPLILILALILSLIFLGPLNLGLFTGGFTASGLEFLLLIWFQVIYGHVYQMTGVIFAAFMAGLVIGSLVLGNGYWVMGNRYWVMGIKKMDYTYKGFLIIQGVFALFSALIALLILLFSSYPFLPFLSSTPPGLNASLPPSLLIMLIFILVLITGMLMGLQFAYNARLRKENIQKSAGESFSADLLGSAIGVVLVSVYVVPLLGLPVTAISLAGLNILAIGVMAFKR